MPRGVRHAILKKVFKVQNADAMFRDAISKYYASAAAATTGMTPQRKGQLMYGKSGSTEKVYIALALTGTALWTDISSAGG